MAEGLSLREFGRQIDVTGEAVRKAIASGKIPADCVGEVTVGKAGRIRPVIIDPARAAKHWGRNRNPNQVRDKAILSEGAKRGWAQRRGEAPPSLDAADDDDDDDGGKKGSGPSINDYKKITEAYKARTAKLDYEERLGQLVNRDQVEAMFVNQVTAARNRLMGVPSDAKTRLPHLSIADLEVLEQLIAAALDDVADDDSE